MTFIDFLLPGGASSPLPRDWEWLEQTYYTLIAAVL
jgi:hypothetical protein